MSFALIKSILVTGTGFGVVAIPFSGVSFNSLYAGGGTWTRGVYIVSKSENEKVKLFVERKDTKETEAEKFELKVAYENKERRGHFILCTPSLNERDYYLLEVQDSSWRKNLNRVTTVMDCNEQSRKNMGEKLVIEVQKEEGRRELLREIDLRSCKINDLRKDGWQKGNPLLELICQEGWASHNSSKKEIKLLSRNYEELKLLKG